jgi:hypothetical protein
MTMVPEEFVAQDRLLKGVNRPMKTILIEFTKPFYALADELRQLSARVIDGVHGHVLGPPSLVILYSLAFTFGPVDDCTRLTLPPTTGAAMTERLPCDDLLMDANRCQAVLGVVSVLVIPAR